MAGWILPVALVIVAESAAPDEPVVPTVTEPALGADAVLDSMGTAPAPQAEPEPEADPVAEPAVSSDFGTDLAASDAPILQDEPPASTSSSQEDGASPVVRAEPGLWGMSFVFGGLAPLSIAGTSDFNVNRLVFTEIGMRRVLDNGWAIPFSVGAGVFHHNPDEGGNQNDVGLSAAVGVRKAFRVWRRIAPYVGGDFRLSYLDPTGDNNWLVGIGLGPNLGIEYYVGDRVSLLLQADATLGFGVFDGLVQVSVATQISAGGQTSLVFYF